MKSSRERIYELIANLRTDADYDYELGIKLLDRASAELAAAEKLAGAIARVPDRVCDEIVKDWERRRNDN